MSKIHLDVHLDGSNRILEAKIKDWEGRVVVNDPTIALTYKGFASLYINISGGGAVLPLKPVSIVAYHAISGYPEAVKQLIDHKDVRVDQEDVSVIVDAICATEIVVQSIPFLFPGVLPFQIKTNREECFLSLCNILKKHPEYIDSVRTRFEYNCKTYPNKDRCKLSFLYCSDIMQKELNSANNIDAKTAVDKAVSSARKISADTKLPFKVIKEYWENYQASKDARFLELIKSIIVDCDLIKKQYKGSDNLPRDNLSLLHFMFSYMDFNDDKTQAGFEDIFEFILSKGYDLGTKSISETSTGNEIGKEIIASIFKVYDDYSNKDGETAKRCNGIARLIFRNHIRKSYKLDPKFNLDISKMIDKICPQGIMKAVKTPEAFDMMIEASVKFFKEYKKLAKDDGLDPKDLYIKLKDKVEGLKKIGLDVSNIEKFLKDFEPRRYQNAKLMDNTNLSDVKMAGLFVILSAISIIGTMYIGFKIAVANKFGKGFIDRMDNIGKALLIGASIAVTCTMLFVSHKKYNKAVKSANKQELKTAVIRL